VDTEPAPYDTLAGVYDWLVPEPLLTPEGAVDAFAAVVDTLDPGARVLDCAAGTGQLSVGLALRGHDVIASDASAAMVERTRALARAHGAEVPAVVCAWETLADQGWGGAFDAVFCVGNSIVHAGPTPRRRAALAAMAHVLRDGGLLAVTSRNWELVRAQGSGLQVADHLTERHGRSGLVIYGWTLPEHTEDPARVDVAVSLVDGGGAVTTYGERFEVWPFTSDQLAADLRACGLTPEFTTYTAEAERYLVTARRSTRVAAAIA